MRIAVMMLYLRKKVMIMPVAGWDFAQLGILFWRAPVTKVIVIIVFVWDSY